MFLANLYKYRELLKTNIQKEIRGKYKGAWLGIIWSYLNPILMLAVYTFVFSIIMKVEIENYSSYLFVGLMPWSFFTATVSQSCLSVIVNGGIIKKVYFPREIIPLSTVTANVVNFLISMIIVLGFLLISGVGISWHILFFPVVLAVQYILLLGIAFILSSITVFARDLEHIVSVILMAGFYATPIVYDLNSVPPRFLKILKLNPMSSIIQSYRDILFYHRLPNMKMLGIVALASFILFAIGYKLFKHLEKSFVEEL